MRSLLLVLLCANLLTTTANADEAQRLLIVRFTPAPHAQIALWIERADLSIFRTVRLTEAVARRGIGNRPGALQMNSGFRWPYGRREGVLPVWAHRRVDAGQAAFRRVIFRDRRSEGAASVASANMFPNERYNDNVDSYFCLPFAPSHDRDEALDAVSCASVFNSDKGRYINDQDIAAGYREPTQTSSGATQMLALDATSLYPPRRDVQCSAGCTNHPDVAHYKDDALASMPELDSVSMATLASAPQRILFDVPADWPDGTYMLYVEANIEGDYNDKFDAERYPTPSDAQAWDVYARTYGYPYRGQPSVVYSTPFTLGPNGQLSYSATAPVAYGSLDGRDAQSMFPMMPGMITDDPVNAPYSGANRLIQDASGVRLVVDVRDASFCEGDAAPSSVAALVASPLEDESNSHQWAHLSFLAAQDDRGLDHYDVRVSVSPIFDDESFMRAVPAQAASLDIVALTVPVVDSMTEVDFGGLAPETEYYVGVRAIDRCNNASPISVARVKTTAIHFTTVSPCFIATAAYGTPLAQEIGTLRRFRDRHLMTNAVGRALVSAYYAHGSVVASAVAEHPWLAASVRTAIGATVALLRD